MGAPDGGDLVNDGQVAAAGSGHVGRREVVRQEEKQEGGEGERDARGGGRSRSLRAADDALLLLPSAQKGGEQRIDRKAQGKKETEITEIGHAPSPSLCFESALPIPRIPAVPPAGRQFAPEALLFSYSASYLEAHLASM